MKNFHKPDRLYPKPLGECSRDLEDHGCSELDLATAFNRLPMDFSEEEFDKALRQAILDNSVCHLMIEGLIEPTWDEKIGEVVFSAIKPKAKKKKRGKAT